MYPLPEPFNDRIAHPESMQCCVCNREWSVWLEPQDRTATCPECGHPNDLGRA